MGWLENKEHCTQASKASVEGTQRVVVVCVDRSVVRALLWRLWEFPFLSWKKSADGAYFGQMAHLVHFGGKPLPALTYHSSKQGVQKTCRSCCLLLVACCLLFVVPHVVREGLLDFK